jgi:hypothetical protein
MKRSYRNLNKRNGWDKNLEFILKYKEYANYFEKQYKSIKKI